MTNYENIKGKTLEEIGTYLCKSMDVEEWEQNKCDDIHCPVFHLCTEGKNGFIAWLEKEVKTT